jgi:prenyltransferase beta subunit
MLVTYTVKFIYRRNRTNEMDRLCSFPQKYGGFSKHPGELPDLLHTFYGICGLSLLGQDGLKALDVSLGVPLG